MSIFISYSHYPDYAGYMKDILERITYELKLSADDVKGQYISPDKKIWLDRGEITVGDDLDETIRNGIDASDYFILFLSPPYMRSAYIRITELPYIFSSARARGILQNIIPVNLIKPNDLAFQTSEQKELQKKLIGNEAEPIVKLTKLVDEYINEFIRQLAIKLNIGNAGAPYPQLKPQTVPETIERLKEQIRNNRFRINRDSQFSKFNNELLIRIKSVKKRETDLIRQSIVFFSGSYDQLINNFIFRIPLNLGEDLTNENFNISKLSRTQNLKSHLKDEARIIDRDFCSDDAVDLIIDRCVSTVYKFLRDETTHNAEKIIIPLYIWFKSEVSYTETLIGKLKTDLHEKVCTGLKGKITGLDNICYFISLIYENELNGSDFSRNLQNILNTSNTSGYTWHISDFTNLGRKDLESWLDLLNEEGIDLSAFNNNFLALCTNDKTITMNDFDDFIIDNKYLT